MHEPEKEGPEGTSSGLIFMNKLNVEYLTGAEEK
jgi:hypothetical protein